MFCNKKLISSVAIYIACVFFFFSFARVVRAIASSELVAASRLVPFKATPPGSPFAPNPDWLLKISLRFVVVSSFHFFQYMIFSLFKLVFEKWMDFWKTSF